MKTPLYLASFAAVQCTALPCIVHCQINIFSHHSFPQPVSYCALYMWRRGDALESRFSLIWEIWADEDKGAAEKIGDQSPFLPLHRLLIIVSTPFNQLYTLKHSVLAIEFLSLSPQFTGPSIMSIPSWCVWLLAEEIWEILSKMFLIISLWCHHFELIWKLFQEIFSEMFKTGIHIQPYNLDLCQSEKFL